MANIVSMAGKGARFAAQGYTLPKPLIPVMGKPMVQRVIECMPASEKWIFILNQNHIDEYHLDKVIREVLPDACITVDTDLLGQASMFCARKFLDNDEEVFVAACDMAFLFDSKKFERAKEGSDLVVWTFSQDERIRANPRAWGYAVLDEDGVGIRDMSVKVPISDDPYFDHVVAATFWFRSAALMFSGIELMMEREIRTNGEYYLDNMPIAFRMMGCRSVIFDVDLIVSWGTPEELRQYERVVHENSFGDIARLGLSAQKVELWKRYFGGLNG